MSHCVSLRAALLLLALVGCACPQPVPVRGAGAGWGVSLGEGRVLTIAHVAGDGEVLVRSDRWRRAEVVKRIPGRPEALVVLEVDGPLPPRVELGEVLPGASGLPVLDAAGRVIALVAGRRAGALVAVPVGGAGEGGAGE